jgi:hypothetical protein
MAQFSMAAEQVIEAFAASMGVVAQAAPDRSYGFEFDSSGTLSLVPSDDSKRIIVCLTRMRDQPNAGLSARLLESAGFDPAVNTTVHAGLGPDGAVVLAAGIDENDFDLQILDGTLSRLIELHNSL